LTLISILISISMGSSGSIRDSAGTVSQPLPAPYTTLGLNDVFFDGANFVVVGNKPAPGELRATLLEKQNGNWVPGAGTSTANFNLYGGWGKYAVGNGGFILRDTGTVWEPIPFNSVPGVSDLRAISGVGPEVFVVGTGGAIWRFTER
jgi:hypothetical protein